MVLARSVVGVQREARLEHLVEVAYFAITEGVWGASLGKALCGFRVVTENGARPRFARALLRALVFILPRWLASGLVLCRRSCVFPAASGQWIVIVVESSSSALLFVTARRANGFAGIHEWVTHTRTVLKSAVEGRRIVRPAPSPIELPASPQWVGPYRTRGRIQRAAELRRRPGIRRAASAHGVAAVPRRGFRSGSAC